VILVATVVLLAALPSLLWPLLRPPELAAPDSAPPETTGELARLVEEVELDLASGRLDGPEAERRLEELRSEAG
jgi:hypothetical protein